MRAEVTFLGHSTVLVEMGGIRVLTDPVLFDRVTILRRAVSTLPAELYRDIDAVVISHLHLDHFDMSSLRLLGKATPLIVPRGAGRLLVSAGFSDVTELAVGASVVVSDLVITATPATHSGFRPPFGPSAEAIGYLLDHANERVYFAGDTDLFPEMVELTDIDLALLPVWGWGPRLGPGHMDPKRAAEALRILHPTAAVPIHWGTLWPIGMGRVMTHLLEGPPVEFARFAAIEAPDVAVLLTPPGQTVPIPR
ncbi:MAG TPA: MBL fold metallo-hydrolase [Candidatus Limnocylindrales bacterium]|nr:MBL fold metallo-hydrolase [Candidatus Limnocylindrales bacterium]